MGDDSVRDSRGTKPWTMVTFVLLAGVHTL
jgi:hypothetical protein